MCLLNGCSRFYPHADRNKTENVIVRLEVVEDYSARCLVDSLSRGAQANAERTLPLNRRETTSMFIT